MIGKNYNRKKRAYFKNCSRFISANVPSDLLRQNKVQEEEFNIKENCKEKWNNYLKSLIYMAYKNILESQLISADRITHKDISLALLCYNLL